MAFFAPCKGIQDSLGLWILRNGFRIPATGFRILLSVELGFRILWLMEFRILRVLFRIPKPRIPDFKATIFWIAESRFLYMGRPFDPGRLEKLRVFVDIICWAPWISLVQSTKLPSIFLKAQPWSSSLWRVISLRVGSLDRGVHRRMFYLTFYRLEILHMLL